MSELFVFLNTKCFDNTKVYTSMGEICTNAKDRVEMIYYYVFQQLFSQGIPVFFSCGFR